MWPLIIFKLGTRSPWPKWWADHDGHDLEDDFGTWMGSIHLNWKFVGFAWFNLVLRKFPCKVLNSWRNSNLVCLILKGLINPRACCMCMGTGLLALRTDTLFTSAPVKGTGVFIYLSILHVSSEVNIEVLNKLFLSWGFPPLVATKGSNHLFDGWLSRISPPRFIYGLKCLKIICFFATTFAIERWYEGYWTHGFNQSKHNLSKFDDMQVPYHL